MDSLHSLICPSPGGIRRTQRTGYISSILTKGHRNIIDLPTMETLLTDSRVTFVECDVDCLCKFEFAREQLATRCVSIGRGGPVTRRF